jgi:hypothetical protein
LRRGNLLKIHWNNFCPYNKTLLGSLTLISTLGAQNLHQKWEIEKPVRDPKKENQKVVPRVFKPGFVVNIKPPFLNLHEYWRTSRLLSERPKLAALTTRDINSKSWPKKIFVFIYKSRMPSYKKTYIKLRRGRHFSAFREA